MTHDWDWTAAESEGEQGCMAALAGALSRPHWLTHMTSEGQAVPSAPWEEYLRDKGSHQGSVQYNLMYVWNTYGPLFLLEVH